MTKVLIIEDNPKNRDMLSRRLIKRGYEIVMAEDGQQGIDMTTSRCCMDSAERAKSSIATAANSGSIQGTWW